MSFLTVFKEKNSTNKQIEDAGERLILKIYNAPANAASLDDLRYINYKRQASSKSLTAKTGFELKALPPTSDAVKYHNYRAYYQV